MPANLPLIYGCPSLLDRLMNNAEQLALPAPPENSTRYYPPVQVSEDGETVYIRANVPGLSLENLQLVQNSGTLTMRGNIPSLPGMYILQTRPTGPFRRDIRLPFPVDMEAMEAFILNGILSLRLPRKPGSQKRFIPVICGKGTSHE